MFNGGFEVWPRKNWPMCGNQIEVRIMDRETHSAMTPQGMQKVEDGGIVPVAFYLETEGAQALMDRLWECGLRPTEGSGSAGALAATERHLADLQKIVFTHLQKDTHADV